MRAVATGSGLLAGTVVRLNSDARAQGWPRCCSYALPVAYECGRASSAQFGHGRERRVESLATPDRDAERREVDTEPRQRGTVPSVRWETIHPVLVAAYRLFEARDVVSGMEIVDALTQDADPTQAPRAIQHLHLNGYLAAEFELASSLPFAVGPTEKGLQLMSEWPSTSTSQAFDRLLSDLASRIAAAPSRHDRRHLTRLRDAFIAVGRDVGIEIISKTITGGGLP